MNYSITFIKRTLFFLFITLLTSVSICAQQVINATLQHDGKTRTYRLYVPQSYDANQPVPLILNFHGYTNSIDIQYNQSNFQQLAEDNQFIYATPQGLGNSAGWAINNFFGGNEDDIGFSNALIDVIESQYNINAKRIYATGFSNGGYFSYRLACELSNRIAAVASVAGSMTAGWIDNGQCQPQHPTAVLQITGTNDSVIPINGGGLGKSINQVMQYWTTYNNGNTTPVTTDLGSGSSRAVYENGNNGVTAEFITVGGKGHSWIGGNVDTSNEIWDFFSRFDIDGALDVTTPPTNDSCSGNITSYPFNESFESSLGDWSNATTGDDINFTRNSGSTPSSTTGPSNAVDGNTYVYVEASGNGTGFPNKRAILNSPCLNFDNLSNPTLTFQYHMFGSTINSLTVEARTANTGNWISIFNRNGEQGDNWNLATVDLTEFAGNNSVQLRFNVLTGSGTNGWQSDIAIDAVSIQNGSTNPIPTCDAINFNDYSITSFSNQDSAGDFSIQNDGAALALTNNTWKYIALDYTVTSNTVIEYEFSSSSEGEIHGLGFEDDNTLTSSRYFKVHGTQNYGVTNYDNYTSGTTTYVIPVGAFYTGSMDRLVFINDNDAGSGNNSTFSNVKIYEGSCGVASISEKTTDLVNITPIYGDEDEVKGTFKMTPNPARDQFTLTVNMENTTALSVKIYTLLGQKKYESVLNSGVNNFSTNDLSLSAGIYIVRVKSQGNKDIIQKLIVK